MISNNWIKTFLVFIAICATQGAYAIPISGELGMGGNFKPIDASGNVVGTDVATGVDFDPNLFIVNHTSGDFTSITSTTGSIQDFQFDPFGGPIANFWEIDGFTFELTSVTQGFTNKPETFLVLNGTGIIRQTGFDDTLGTWNFTGDTTNGGVFTWSAGSAIATPAPGLLALLSIGLITMGVTLRRKG